MTFRPTPVGFGKRVRDFRKMMFKPFVRPATAIFASGRNRDWLDSMGFASHQWSQPPFRKLKIAPAHFSARVLTERSGLRRKMEDYVPGGTERFWKFIFRKYSRTL